MLPLSVVEPVTNIVKHNKHHITHAKQVLLQLRNRLSTDTNAVKVEATHTSIPNFFNNTGIYRENSNQRISTHPGHLYVHHYIPFRITHSIIVGNPKLRLQHP
jgi:hypothetical protein